MSLELNQGPFGGSGMNGGSVDGPLILSGDPTSSTMAATKQYTDSRVSAIPADSISSGTFNTDVLPALTGDVNGQAGTNTLLLSNTGVTAGAGSRLTVDTKGRVLLVEELTPGDIPSFNFSKITTGLPTTLNGYGITDAANKGGSVMTGFVSQTNTPTLPLNSVTKAYVDAASAAASSFSPGDITARPSAASVTGFLACNGAAVDKTTYSALYSVVGDKYAVLTQPGNGQPWKQQVGFNTQQSTDITGWATAASLPTTLAYSQIIVTKNRIHILGGHNGSAYTSATYSAPINSDGTIGAWAAGTALPIVLSNSLSAVIANHVYLVGGITTGGAYSNAVYFAPINSDGTLGAWSTTTALPDVLTYSQCIVTSNRLYVLGGLNSGGFTSNTYSALINSDGTLGAWTAGTALPGALAHSQAVITPTRVYLLGGYNGGYTSIVYYANFNSDGTLGNWSTGTSLPGALAVSQVVATAKRIYLIGGGTSSNYVSTVYTAPINTDGSIGTWAAGTSLPGGMAYSQSVVTKDHVYILGGLTTGGSYVSTVYSASFAGGADDYSTYYDGTITATPSTSFVLPTYSKDPVTGLSYFIRY